MTPPAKILTLQVAEAWARLNRAESSALASLLDAAEMAAVNRRLNRPVPKLAWVPATMGPEGGRFGAPNGPGVLYLGADLDTCVAEVQHHHALFCAQSTGAPVGTRATFLHLSFGVKGGMADVSKGHTALHDPNDYSASWAYGWQVRAADLDGVHYRSVRKRGSRCVGVFKDGAVNLLRQETGAVILEWDGTASRRTA